MKAGMSVYEAMTNRPITAPPETSLKDAARLMSEKHVNSLLIVQQEKILGVVVDEDFVRKVVTQDKPSMQEPVTSIMTKNVVTIDPAADINDALLVMREHTIRQLPVIEKGKLIGIITMKDILRVQPELIDIIVEKYKVWNEEQDL